MGIDIMTLTASKNYTDKQIEKASISGGGGSSGYDVMMVGITHDGDNFVADKSSIEIQTACAAGKIVFALITMGEMTMCAPFVGFDGKETSTYAIFGMVMPQGINATSLEYIYFYVDDYKNVSAGQKGAGGDGGAGAAGAGVMWVTGEEDGTSADHTGQEIIEAFNAGMMVYFNCVNGVGASRVCTLSDVIPISNKVVFVSDVGSERLFVTIEGNNMRVSIKT